MGQQSQNRSSPRLAMKNKRVRFGGSRRGRNVQPLPEKPFHCEQCTRNKARKKDSSVAPYKHGHHKRCVFHFLQRIIREMRPGHVHFFDAVGALRNCIYRWCQSDFDAFVDALKSGCLKWA